MSIPKLNQAPLSFKLLSTAVLIMIALTYLALAVHIYIDTQMKPSMIVEAFGFMEYIGLTTLTHDYLPYYGLFIFTIPALMLMASSYSENVKCFFAIWPFVLIAVDIASMWLTAYAAPLFAYVLFVAGSSLALTFLVMFIMILAEIWFRTTKAPELA